MGGGGNTSGGGPSGSGGPSLAETYPVNTLMELTISPTNAIVRGLVYCTDAFSNTVVLKKSLVHTTLASEITVIHVSNVVKSKALDDGSLSEDEAKELAGVADLNELKLPLPHVSRRALEERERRAVRLAEESFSHVNQRASPEGQKIFDKLLKACNEVVWRGESILVLKEIRVDPPYAASNCALVGSGSGGTLDAHSLERVKRIVSSV